VSKIPGFSACCSSIVSIDFYYAGVVGDGEDEDLLIELMSTRNLSVELHDVFDAQARTLHRLSLGLAHSFLTTLDLTN